MSISTLNHLIIRFVTAMALTFSKVVPACLCFSGLQSLKGFQRAAAAPTTYSSPCLSVFNKRFLKGLKGAAAAPRPIQATAIVCFSRRSSLPLAGPHTFPPTATPRPSVSKGLQACHTPRPSFFAGVQTCRQTLQTLPRAFPRQL